ncbi:MAG: NCS2 family permease [candidate division Zixibacteria bacterium]|nr:NCS2 family permease [candidate division Zixibacteria bacterium]
MNAPQKTDFSPNILERFFHLKELNTNFKVELLAGVTTFLTMSYIIFVNPLFLSFFGDPDLRNMALPFSASMTATCLASALMCVFMGLWTNYPFALAPGMGLNAVVSYQMVLSLGLSWPQAMGVIVLEGLAITILVITGLREAVMNSIPMSLKQAISIGIGLFLAFIGLQNAGFVKAHPVTFVALGDFTKWQVIISVFGLLATAIMMKRKIRGALLLGIVFSTFLAVILNYLTGLSAFPDPGKAVIPKSVLSVPDLSTFGKFDFSAITKLGLLPALMLIFSVMLSDFFDTLGSVIGLGTEGKFLDQKGNLPRIKRVLLVDSLAAVMGGVASSSSATTYIESAAGISAGGRTGFSTVIVGILFLLAIFFSPLADIVPKEATAPALIIVGFLMLTIVKEIPFEKFEEAFPAFLIMIVMPLTYSISNGIGFGFIAYTLIMLLSGKGRQVHLLMYLVSIAFTLNFLLPVLKVVFKF